MSDQWMSIVEYARKYNVSDMTVRRRIRTGRIQAVLREGKYFIPVRSTQPLDLRPEENADTLAANPFAQPSVGQCERSPAQEMHQPIARHIPNTHRSADLHKHSLGHTAIGSANPLHVQAPEPAHLRESFREDVLSPRTSGQSQHTSSSPLRQLGEARNPDAGTMAKLMQIMHDDNKKLAEKIDQLERICQSSNQGMKSIYNQLERNYQDRIQSLEASLDHKDEEVELLSQKVQDLQLLISILEQRNAP